MREYRGVDEAFSLSDPIFAVVEPVKEQKALDRLECPECQAVLTKKNKKVW